jgi:hypothetical protein
MPITSWTPQNVYRPVLGGFRPAALATKEIAKAIAPRKTGRLASATGVLYTGSTSALLVNRTPYIFPVVRGAKAHEIDPRTKEAVTVGKHPFAHVQHPGARAQPFLNEAAAAFSALYPLEVRRRWH